MQAEIRAEYAQILVVDDAAGDEALDTEWSDSALDLRLVPFPGGFMVGTPGDGVVAVDVEALEREPATDGAAWDHVVRASVELPSGELAVAGPSFTDVAEVRVEPGRYGVEARFLDFAEPHPRCSLRLWPDGEAPAGPALVATSASPIDAHDAALRRHLRRIWPHRRLEAFVYTGGPIQHSVPTFSALRFGPDPGAEDCVYVSSGASRVTGRDGERFEFAVHAGGEEALYVELLAALTHYHHDPSLGLHAGRVVDLGREWLEESPADHLALARSWPGLEPLPPARTPSGPVDFLWARLVDAQEAAELHG